MTTTEINQDEIDLIAEILEKEETKPAVEFEPVYPTRKATDEECEKAVEELIAEFPFLVKRATHWSLSLISLIHKIQYRPSYSIVAFKKKYDHTTVGDIGVVNTHLSPAVLHDLKDFTRTWVANNPEKAHEVEERVEILIGDEGSLSYVEHKTTIEAAASVEKEGWASW